MKALCLHIAHDCNLGCKYCFAEEGEYHGRRALMSFEVGEKALNFLHCQLWRNTGMSKWISLEKTTDELGSGKTAGGVRTFPWRNPNG